jgi:hypothetical protein
MRETFKGPVPLGWGRISSEFESQVSKPPTSSTTPPTVGWIGRLFHKPEPTLFQRCLAVHIIAASQRGALH